MSHSLLQRRDPRQPKFSLKGLTCIPYVLCLLYFIYGSYRYATVQQNGDYTTLFYVIHSPIHEVGHAVFSGSCWPEILHVLGGSIFQCLAPIAAGIQFICIREYPASAVALGWLGFAVQDMAVYMRDAQVRELPLVAPFVSDVDIDYHDWYYIFSHWGILEHCEKIASVTAALGYAMTGAAVLGILVMIIRGVLWKTPAELD